MALGIELAQVVEATNQSSTEVISAFNRIPYGLISRETNGAVNDTLAELTQICKYYKIYRKGNDFLTEGSNGDYVPSQLHYKLSAGLVDKEARFLFGDAPDITINPKGSQGKPSEEQLKNITTMQDLVDSVLVDNKFEQILVKAARDCFIGKRVACLVNFNVDDGITVTFLPSTQFIYEYRMNSTELEKFVAFIIVKDSITLSERRIFMKRYTTEYASGPDGVTSKKIFLDEALYDGGGRLINEITDRMEILLDRIPAVVILNDGLTGDTNGESEIEALADYEQMYSKLSNADIDAERKGMNQIKYAIDMDSNSTKGLSTAPGAFWDLGSDQNLDSPSPQVGTIEPNMGYSTALADTLKRIKSSAYDQIEMPDITLESMTGVISSGKALKAVYWPLIVRCKEKMKTWGPNLSLMVDIIIRGAMAYPDTASRYIEDPLIDTNYEVDVDQKIPIPEDETEEKTSDLAEVTAQTMSRKSYMKKWHELTDDEAMAEIEQIAIERQILEDSAFSSGPDGVPYSASTGDEMPEGDEDFVSEEEPDDGVSDEVDDGSQELQDDAGDTSTEPDV